jgi:hypothetical protein
MLRRLMSRANPPTGCEPIRTGADLLAVHEDKVKAIAELAGVPPSVFQAFYWEPLAAYAAFVQTLPVSPELPDRVLLDNSLGRVIRALNRRRGYLLPTGAEAEVIAAQADSWTYAVFLASLLQGLGKPTIDRKVTLLDKKYCCLGCWEPWRGAMKAPAMWYQMSFTPESYGELARRVVPLLVPYIVPPAGLKWLWSNPVLLACWIGAISGEARSAGILGEIIELPCNASGPMEPSPAPRSATVPHEVRMPTEPKTALTPPEPPADAGVSAAVQTDGDPRPAAVSGAGLSGKSNDPGRAFLSWLQERISKGQIAFNGTGAHVYRVPEGLLLVSPGIFREYDELNWRQVQKRFLKLKVHVKSRPGNNFVTYRFADNPSAAITGLLIPDSKSLFGNEPLPPIEPNFMRNGTQLA